MTEDVETKTVTYFDMAEYRRGREKMWADGWVIADRRKTPGRVPYVSGGGWLDILAFPLMWLLNRTQPEELLVVTYVRERRL